MEKTFFDERLSSKKFRKKQRLSVAADVTIPFFGLKQAGKCTSSCAGCPDLCALAKRQSTEFFPRAMIFIPMSYGPRALFQ